MLLAISEDQAIGIATRVALLQAVKRGKEESVAPISQSIASIRVTVLSRGIFLDGESRALKRKSVMHARASRIESVGSANEKESRNDKLSCRYNAR